MSKVSPYGLKVFNQLQNGHPFKRVAIFLWLMIFFGLNGSRVSVAAEVYVSDIPSGKRIIIEGRIIEGDFEKFLNAVIEQGIYTTTVHLASNGGNVAEALKIGRFIRLNSMATETGTRTQGRNICVDSVKPHNCNCASACVLIFLGGIHRSGNMLGVHRPYLEHTVLKSLSLPESEVAGRLLEKETDKYFQDMGAPTSLKEILNANTSENIQMLEDGYINQNLAGYIKEVEEWLLAKCGSTKNLHSSKPTEMRDALNHLNCREQVLRNERRNLFAEKLAAALSLVVRADKIPKGSILLYLYQHRGGLGDMIGKPLPEVIRMFAFYGIGLQKDFNATNPESKAFRIADAFDIRLDANNLAREISFRMSEDDEQSGYTGLFNISPPAGGKMTVKDVANLYGRPLWAGCMSEGGCYAWFSTQYYEIEFSYDREKKTVTSASFAPPGYFRHLLEKVSPTSTAKPD